jgi:hypothetical protein
MELISLGDQQHGVLPSSPGNGSCSSSSSSRHQQQQQQQQRRHLTFSASLCFQLLTGSASCYRPAGITTSAADCSLLV